MNEVWSVCLWKWVASHSSKVDQAEVRSHVQPANYLDMLKKWCSWVFTKACVFKVCYDARGSPRKRVYLRCAMMPPRTKLRLPISSVWSLFPVSSTAWKIPDLNSYCPILISGNFYWNSGSAALGSSPWCDARGLGTQSLQFGSCLSVPRKNSGLAMILSSRWSMLLPFKNRPRALESDILHPLQLIIYLEPRKNQGLCANRRQKTVGGSVHSRHVFLMWCQQWTSISSHTPRFV